MTERLSLIIDRASRLTLAEQIHRHIAAAINNKLLLPEARLPSWRDLAAQLGVARGTVRTAYERLIDARLIVSSTPGGTRVAARPAPPRLKPQAKAGLPPSGGPSIMDIYPDFTAPAAMFQMGMPSQEGFPSKLVARLRSRAVRQEVNASPNYPDPRGELCLRREIAAHLAIARGLACEPSQIFITSGFSGALGLSLCVLGLEGRKAWIENPGFPIARKGLEVARLKLVPVPVDAEGMNVDHALSAAPDAALALVTPGQQAPLGPSLSRSRRLQLLSWAARSGAWIIEDDYLSELQLKGRVAPALASLDDFGRVIHVGSFSKTISPTLRLGFVVIPPALVARFTEAAASLYPAPGPSVQIATADFMREGHYLRHLRKTKRIYAHRRDVMMDFFARQGLEAVAAGLAVMLRLPDPVPDHEVAKAALAQGLAPAPLSQWYTSPESQRQGLLLNVAAVPDQSILDSCERLCELVASFA